MASLRLAEANFGRTQELFHQSVASQQDRDESQYRLDSTKAELASAREALDLLHEGTREEQVLEQAARVESLRAHIQQIAIAIGESQIAAPFDGHVAARHVDEGTVVSAGQAILEIVESSEKEVRVGLPADQCSAAQQQLITLHYAGLQLRSEPVRISPTIDQRTRTRELVFRIMESAAEIPIGAPIVVQCPVTQSHNLRTINDGFWVPTDSLTAGARGLWAVFIAASDVPPESGATSAPTHAATHHIERRQVELLRSHGQWSLVRGPVRPDELLVVDGVHTVVPGQAVPHSTLNKSALSMTHIESTATHPVARLAQRYYRDRRLLALSLLLILASGLSSLAVLPRMEDPILTQRAATLTTLLPGADAERVEALITEKIEDKLRNIPEIKRIRSQSRAGISFISIELLDELYDTPAVWSKLRGKIEDSIALLPAEASRPEFNELEVAAYAWIGAIVWQRDDAELFGVMRRLARAERFARRFARHKRSRLVRRPVGRSDRGGRCRTSCRGGAIGDGNSDAVAGQRREIFNRPAVGRPRVDREDAERVSHVGRHPANRQSTPIDLVTRLHCAMWPPYVARRATAPPKPSLTPAWHCCGDAVRPEYRINHWSTTPTRRQRVSSAIAGRRGAAISDGASNIRARADAVTVLQLIAGCHCCRRRNVSVHGLEEFTVRHRHVATGSLDGRRPHAIPRHSYSSMSITGLIIATRHA